MTPAEVLRGAAQVIRERGWCQGRSEDAAGCVCASFALEIVAEKGEAEDSDLFYDALVLAEEATGQMHSLTFWNDTEGRTVEEVLSVLERAAEAAA